MDVEVDVEKDVLGFSPTPPKRKLLDFVPNFIIDRFRRWFGFPQPTPREHWFLTLWFVRTSLTTLLTLDAERSAAPPPKPVDDADPFRFN